MRFICLLFLCLALVRASDLVAAPVQISGGNGAGTSPTITVIDPASGRSGSILVITGTGFSPAVLSNRVQLAGVPAVVLSSTPVELRVVIPQGIPVGNIQATVTINGRTSAPVDMNIAGAGSTLLSAARTPNSIYLSWPTNPPAHIESSFNLSQAPSWLPITNVPVIEAGRFAIHFPFESQTRFFRLRSSEAVTNTEPAVASTGRAIVPAAAGGTVTTEDQSATLVIPPGALAEDTEITVSSISITDAEAGPAGDIILSPSGLAFSTPARLIVKTSLNPPSGSHLTVEMLSASNTPREVGGEGSYFVPITNYVHTPDGRLEVPIQHFSGVSWGWWSRNLYAVLELQGKYLQKGDLIYVLTGADSGQGGDWLPGHCGMYLGTQEAFSFRNDGETIIESTSTNALFDGTVRFENLRQGFNSFQSLSGTHIYMGARRPTQFVVTDNERTEIADWAIGQLGKPYALTGGPFLANDAPLWDGYTCVGLTELAYEFGGNKRIVPQAARLLLTPLRQFVRTSPVDTIEVEVGENFTVKVTGVVNKSTVANDYYTDDALYTRTLDLDLCSPDARAAISDGRAKLEQLIGTLFFSPTANDVGKDIKFAVTIDGSRSGVGKETAYLTTVVKPSSARFVRKDPPTIQNFSYSGNLNPTNLTVSVSEAFIRQAQGGTTPMRLFWDAPPETLSPGETFSMEIHVDSGDNPDQLFSAFGSPYLVAQVNDTLVLSDNSPAFVGYEFVRQQASQRVYQLVERPLNKTALAGDTPFVVIELRAFRSSGAFTSGEVGAYVIWNYERVETP